MTLDTDQPSLQATVLVVTDDYTEGDNLTRFLVRQGLTVVRAETGAQCWELVRTHTVDVVLLDVKMSGIDCSTLCKALTQISPAPAMILVNEDDWAARALARALEAGENTIVVNARGDTSLKISDHAGILARVQAHLSIRRGEQEADRGAAAIEPPTPLTRADCGSAAIEPTKAPTILVVDGNPDTVKILTHLLLRHGMTVLQAYNGPDCLEIVRTHPVDVILLDVTLPGMNGLAVCAELKQISPTLPTQVIIVTAKDDLTTRAAAIASGVSGFVAKPINHADLLARIQALLSIRRGEQEADRGAAAIEPPTPPTRADCGSAASEPTKAPPTILIVNDNPDSVEIFAAILIRKSGMQVQVLKAYNGRECLEILRTHTVDLILLDDYMPVMDGLAVCAALQHTAAPPIIFMTTDTVQLEAQRFPTVTPAKREAALRLGAREAVAIPIVNRADFSAQIRRLLHDR